jgi:hypothetical protein
VENTCRKEKCNLWKLMDGECPNYIQSWFAPSPMVGGEPKLIEDCAPIRNQLMLQQVINMIIGLQKTQNDLRNETVWVQVVAEVIGKSTGVDLERFVEARKLLDRKIDTKNILTERNLS